MKFNKQKYDNNERIVYNTALGLLVGAFVLLGLAILILRNFEYLEDTLGVFAGIGMISTVVLVIIGNVRLVRFIFIVRKENTEVNVWKSAISIGFGLTSLLIYWFILLLLALQNIF